MMTWNSDTTPPFSTPPKPHQSPRKCAPGRTRTRWSNCNHWFNPIRTNRYNTPVTEPNDMNKIDIVQPSPKRSCECSDSSCTYYKYEAPHTLPRMFRLVKWGLGWRKSKSEGAEVINWLYATQARHWPTNNGSDSRWHTLLETDHMIRWPRQKITRSHRHTDYTARSIRRDSSGRGFSDRYSEVRWEDRDSLQNTDGTRAENAEGRRKNMPYTSTC